MNNIEKSILVELVFRDDCLMISKEILQMLIVG